MKIPKFIRTYRFEIIIFALAAIAIVLLVGDASNNLVKGITDRVYDSVWAFTARIGEWLRLRFAKFTPADFVAFVLLVIVAGLVFWRVRQRVSNAPGLNVRVCPRCGSKLHRAHRKPLDRVWSAILFLSLKRYACVDRKCGWNGLVTAKSRWVELEPVSE
jgi:hypothetical protein